MSGYIYIYIYIYIFSSAQDAPAHVPGSRLQWEMAKGTAVAQHEL